MQRFMVGLVALTLAACGDLSADPEVDAPEQEPQAIQGGRVTHAYPAVGLVLTAHGALCTGTLVAPRVVLTAAHCIHRDTAVSFYTGDGAAVTARQGLEQALSTMEDHAVTDEVADPRWVPDSCGTTPDLALLRLSQPVANVAPVPVAASSAGVDGRTCTAVGFGAHGEGTRQTLAGKRSATVEVVEVTRQSLEVQPVSGTVDHGDSGGPLLCGSKLVGVISCGEEVDWHERHAFYARPDSDSTWLQRRLVTWSR